MSWVFLADDRVYKLKKPVKYPFLDFSTLDRRRFYCEEELRLNRRLASQTYLAVIPLRVDRTGRLALNGHGLIIDWLVEMKRLRHADMLDVRLREGRVSEADVRRIGELMARFYMGSTPEVADGGLYLKHLADEQAVNRTTLQLPELWVRDVASPVLDAADRALGSIEPKIRRRIADGHIVEGHGDLRPEHVNLGEPVQIIDCLEFSRPMRILDPYDEVNYIGLECSGRSWIRAFLLNTLAARLGGRPDGDLLAFYGGFRMLLRARLCMAHLLEAPVRQPEKWKPLALSYIALAKHQLSFPYRPDPRSTPFV
ncbi:hypothetical protein [Pseudaminobacter sp. NGMCC 1.201702]|uniref:hypothetical protein n=1 Tax=Pseudaminobacter sp. NGMCC 1.201702 TaxID=3391825 RepID=UPI0039F07F02